MNVLDIHTVALYLLLSETIRGGIMDQQLIISGALAQNAPVFTNHAVSLSLFNMTDPFVVRLVSTGREGYPMSAWLLDNVTLNVEALPVATAVPEPTTLLLLGTGISFIATSRRRRSLV